MVIAFATASALAAIILAWLVGRIASDRWLWSQWLSWIPTPAPLIAAVFGLLLSARPGKTPQRRRRRAMCWATAVVFVAGYFCLIEHHMLRRPSNRIDGIKFVHWNMTQWKYRRVEQFAEALTGMDGDFIIVSGIDQVVAEPEVREWMHSRRVRAVSYPFTVFSKLPILELRPLVHVDGIVITLLVLDSAPGSTDAAARADGAGTGTTDGVQPLAIYLVDLPSDRSRPRGEIAMRIRELLESHPDPIPEPDIVLGDFNMTRMSRSIRTAFPGMRHAYDDAGAGYAATFHRDWPLFQIDHMLLSNDLRAVRYEIIDPGVSRHFAQAAWIEFGTESAPLRTTP